MSIYDKASLVLIPSGTKTSKVYSQKPVSGDGDFTFSRSTAATRVNADGHIEKETQNLFTYSNTFSDASWGNVRSSVTSGVTDPFGGSNAWSFRTDTTADAQHYMYKLISESGVGTLSIYAKANGYNWLRMRLPSEEAYFDLDNGVTGSSTSGISASMTDAGGGWYRCEVAISDISSSTTIFMHIAEGDGDININGTPSGSDGLYIYAAQLEQGLVARDYIETTTSAVEGGITDNVPRLDYTDASCPSLLLEPQRTNQVTNSEYVSSSDYVVGNWTGTITTNTTETTSPEGLYNATKYVKSGASDRVYFHNSQPDGAYTGSIYLKAASGSENTTIEISVRRFGGGGGSTSKLVTITSEWQRFSVTATNLTGGTTTAMYVADFSMGGTATEFYSYGMQIEAGSYATSYIPTYGSAVTRNLDSCVATSVSDIIGQTEGVAYFEWDYQNTGSSGGNIIISLAGASLQELYFWVKPDGTYVYDVYDSTKQAGITGSIGSFGIKKIALAYKNNDFALYINGALAGTDTSGSVPTLTDVYLGRYAINTNYNISSGIKQTLLFKTRLSNEELATLTTI